MYSELQNLIKKYKISNDILVKSLTLRLIESGKNHERFLQINFSLRKRAIDTFSDKLSRSIQNCEHFFNIYI